MLFVFVHEMCIYESLESPTRPDPKTKFHRMVFSGYMTGFRWTISTHLDAGYTEVFRCARGAKNSLLNISP